MGRGNEFSVKIGDIVKVEPPETKLGDSGLVVTTVASRITDDYELVPVGLVITAPSGFVAKAAERAEPDLAHHATDHSAVVGSVNDNEVFNRLISNRQSWYRRSAERRIKKAQHQAARAVLSHLGLDYK